MYIKFTLSIVIPSTGSLYSRAFKPKRYKQCLINTSPNILPYNEQFLSQVEFAIPQISCAFSRFSRAERMMRPKKKKTIRPNYNFSLPKRFLVYEENHPLSLDHLNKIDNNLRKI